MLISYIEQSPATTAIFNLLYLLRALWGCRTKMGIDSRLSSLLLSGLQGPLLRTHQRMGSTLSSYQTCAKMSEVSALHTKSA